MKNLPKQRPFKQQGNTRSKLTFVFTTLSFCFQVLHYQFKTFMTRFASKDWGQESVKRGRRVVDSGWPDSTP